MSGVQVIMSSAEGLKNLDNEQNEKGLGAYSLCSSPFNLNDLNHTLLVQIYLHEERVCIDRMPSLHR